jgi:hypothetical protein
MDIPPNGLFAECQVLVSGGNSLKFYITGIFFSSFFSILFKIKAKKILIKIFVGTPPWNQDLNGIRRDVHSAKCPFGGMSISAKCPLIKISGQLRGRLC